MNTFEVEIDKSVLEKCFNIQHYDHMIATELFMADNNYFRALFKKYAHEWFLVSTDKMIRKKNLPYQLSREGVFQYPFTNDKVGKAIYSEVIVEDPFESVTILHHTNGAVHVIDRYEGIIYFCYNDFV